MIQKDEVTEILKATQDPELEIDIFTLGLIYGIELNDAGDELRLTMTFTTPFCPYGPTMIADLKKKFEPFRLKKIDIDVVFDPPWEPPLGIREMLGV